MRVAMGRRGAKAQPGGEQKEFSIHLQQLAKETMSMLLEVRVNRKLMDVKYSK